MSPASQFVESTLSSNDIVVFSKSWCPYCRKTKSLLTGDSEFTSKFPDVTVKILDVDLMDDGDDIHHAAKEKTIGNGRDRVQTSVPAVFVKQQFLGGNDDLQAAWKNGSLTKLLTA